MALADSDNNEKPSETNKQSEKRERPLTKVVIRRLPPGISQESFLTQVSPIPDYNYIYTVKGDMSLGEFSFSRVYINFCNAEDIYPFKEKFDNYVFVDTKGHEYAAVVEFASFQKVPKRRGKPRSDPKCGTIETDHLYLEFIESLKKEEPNQDEKPEYSYQPPTENKNDNSTPLLEYIKQRRIDRQRIRDEKKEERRKKEFERKKVKDDDRRKHYEEKSPNKASAKASTSLSKSEESKEKVSEDKPEDKADKTNDKADPAYEKPANVGNLTYRNRKFEDRKPPSYKSKAKFNAREGSDYYDRRDSYKSRREEKEKDYKKKVYDDPKKEDPKKDAAKSTKKIKKYSERREEMKAKQSLSKDVKDVDPDDAKAPSKKLDEKEYDDDDYATGKDKEDYADYGDDDQKQDGYLSGDSGNDMKCDKESRHKNKENDPRLQRRIKNKDRPTMALYQPGKLRKKNPDGEPEPKPICPNTPEDE